jgi:hypothetical protein
MWNDYKQNILTLIKAVGTIPGFTVEFKDLPPNNSTQTLPKLIAAFVECIHLVAIDHVSHSINLQGRQGIRGD